MDGRIDFMCDDVFVEPLPDVFIVVYQYHFVYHYIIYYYECVDWSELSRADQLMSNMILKVRNTCCCRINVHEVVSLRERAFILFSERRSTSSLEPRRWGLALILRTTGVAQSDLSVDRC